jgi:hypothetical protein
MAPKHHRQDFTLVHKVWLLDHSDKHPGVSAADLGKALADHIAGQRANDQVPVLPDHDRFGLQPWDSLNAGNAETECY